VQTGHFDHVVTELLGVSLCHVSIFPQRPCLWKLDVKQTDSSAIACVGNCHARRWYRQVVGGIVRKKGKRASRNVVGGGASRWDAAFAEMQRARETNTKPNPDFFRGLLKSPGER